MNGQDKVAEPSMEEILASIRKIIAEEPEPGRAAPVTAGSPFAKTAAPESSGTARPFGASEERPRPSMDRLTNAIKAKARPAAPEMPLTPKRALAFDDIVADLLEEPKEPVAEASAQRAASEPMPEPTPAEAATPEAATPEPAPLETASHQTGRVEPGARPASDSRRPPIPMRNKGFFPPPGFVPLPDSVLAAVTPPPPDPHALDEAPGPTAAGVVDAHSEPVDRSEVEIARSAAAPQVNGRYREAVGEAHLEPMSLDAILDADTGASRAAARALDELAQGLAAPRSSRPGAGANPQTASDVAALAALVAQPLLPATSDRGTGAVRTLEDAVADMLKPMLQQWLTDNMPRIIERALSIEARGGRDRNS